MKNKVVHVMQDSEKYYTKKKKTAKKDEVGLQFSMDWSGKTTEKVNLFLRR